LVQALDFISLSPCPFGRARFSEALLRELIDESIDLALNYRQSGHPGGSRSKVHLFLALLLPQLRGRRALAAAVVAAAIALALVPVVPAGIPIVAASAACLVGWRPR